MSQTILVVEDNQRDFDILQKILNQEKFTVIHASTGKHAKVFLEDNVPDLVFLDIMLPDTDGFELCRYIREHAKIGILPVVFLSASSSIDNKLLALQLGASDFISKNGLDGRELLLRIRNLLGTKKMLDELLRLSVIDSLTHVYNRRYFQQRLLDEFERAKRYTRDLSCVIVDLDYFKQINDTYGHQAGDHVLKKIASLLRFNTRSADVVSRYGGDEFALLLPETDLKGAQLALSRILEVLIRAPGAKKSAEEYPITLSCGISSLLQGNAMGMDELVTQADVALYTAKRNGRNQVRLYGT